MTAAILFSHCCINVKIMERKALIAIKILIGTAGLTIMIMHLGWGALGVGLFMWANNFDYVQKQ